MVQRKSDVICCYNCKNSHAEDSFRYSHSRMCECLRVRTCYANETLIKFEYNVTKRKFGNGDSYGSVILVANAAAAKVLILYTDPLEIDTFVLHGLHKCQRSQVFVIY